MEVTVYGYLDGERVTKYGYVRHEYDPPPMKMPPAPAGQPKPQYDNRYSSKQKYRYDEKGNLAERMTFGNDGKLMARSVYGYNGNQVDVLFYSADGELNRKEIVKLDGKGHEIEKTVVEPKRNETTRYSYTYESDAAGNWVKRTTAKWVEKDGKSFYEPGYITHRIITYY